MMTEDTSQTQDLVTNGGDQTFMADVVEASMQQPVIVDFWGPHCGPCRTLMPILERQVEAREGKVKMVKINVDENPGVFGQLGGRSIPAVFAFKDGQPVDGFMGAQPESELTKFVGKLTGGVDVAAEAAILAARAKDSLAAGDPGGAAQDFASALQMDPQCAEALAGLARLYLDSGQDAEARALIGNAPDSLNTNSEINSVRAALALLGGDNDAPAQTVGDDGTADLEAIIAAKPDDLDGRLVLAKALAKAGRNGDAVDHLLYSIAKNRAHDDEAARKFLLTIFEAEGVESEIAIDGRKRLASILFA